MTLYAGLMSGTSMDGIDVAILDVETHQLVSGFTKPYSHVLKERLLEITDSQSIPISLLGEVNTRIGREFSEAILEAMEKICASARDIKAIGSHGQTVAHNTFCDFPYTMQLGCSHTIAERTQIPVVSDFRTRDIVLEGQGAPFAPLYHQALFSHLAIEKPLAIVNVGGIANITWLSSGNLKGWDIGPGNCLMDAWIKQHRNESLDRDGNWALQGRVLEDVLTRMQKDEFFAKSAPKSIGKEYFSLHWLNQFIGSDEKSEDIQATLLALTVWAISESVETSRLLLCGGGVHNGALFRALQEKLSETLVQKTDEISIPSDYLEAMMFAWLASRTIIGEPVDLRSVTGSIKPALSGVIYSV